MVTNLNNMVPDKATDKVTGNVADSLSLSVTRRRTVQTSATPMELP